MKTTKTEAQEREEQERLSKVKLTDKELRDHISPYWRKAAKNAENPIILPMKDLP